MRCAAPLPNVQHAPRRCPDELEEKCKGKEAVVDLVDKTSEEYKAPPKPKYVAYGGEGMSLGG